MRFVQFLRKSNPQKCLGVLSEDGKSLVTFSNDAGISNDMITFISQGPNMDEIKKKLSGSQPEEVGNDITLLPPVSNPEKIVCIGMNYLDHCQFLGKPKPEEPMFFSKYASAIVGPTGNIIAHKQTSQVDWEVELAVIIGKEARHVPKEKAFDYVFGYAVSQDISARDWQRSRNGGQFLIGKSMDTFCPLGPAIVHKSLVQDVYNLQLITRVNGVEKQNGNTTNMIYKIDDIIYNLTQCITLKPGDVILTGTPAGVGMYKEPPEFLKPGDVVESEIQQIGRITNKVVADD